MSLAGFFSSTLARVFDYTADHQDFGEPGKPTKMYLPVPATTTGLTFMFMMRLRDGVGGGDYKEYLNVAGLYFLNVGITTSDGDSVYHDGSHETTQANSPSNYNTPGKWVRWSFSPQVLTHEAGIAVFNNYLATFVSYADVRVYARVLTTAERVHYKTPPADAYHRYTFANQQRVTNYVPNLMRQGSLALLTDYTVGVTPTHYYAHFHGAALLLPTLPSTARTISAWIRVPETAAPESYVIDNRDRLNGTGGGYVGGFGSDGIRLYIADQQDSGNLPLLRGAGWVQMFLEDEAFAAPTLLGRYSWNSGGATGLYDEVDIADVRVYDQYFTPAEKIQGCSPTANLLAHYDLRNTNGLVLVDISGNGLDGTIGTTPVVGAVTEFNAG